MKEQFASLWAKVVENKETVIRATAIVAGAAIGFAVAAVVINNSGDNLLVEELELEEVITDMVGE